MKRLTLLAVALFGLMAFQHPATAAASTAPDTEPTALEAQPDRRNARYYARRVDSDIDRYVRSMGYELRLNQRQEREVRRILHQRTRSLMNHTHPANLHRVYPFPRHEAHLGNQRASQWWHQTDARIESVLRPQQVRQYRRFASQHLYSRRDAYYNQHPGYDHQPARPSTRDNRRGRF